MNTATTQPAPVITEDDAPGMAGTLQELLSEISTSVDLADRRYAEVVAQMQEKLAALDTLSKTKREKAEETARRQAEEEAARVAAAEAKLRAETEAAETERKRAQEAAEAEAQAEADRLAKAVEAAKAAAAQAIERSKSRSYPADVDPFDIIDHSPSRTREPWDTESADVFTRHFEEFESLLPQPSAASRQLDRFHPSQPAPQPLFAAPEPPAERAWLEGRFNDIAARISEMMETNAGAGLGARFESLEGRIDAAMTTVATQATSGSDTLKLIETHIAEIDDHVDYIRNELTRLDGVEAQIRALMERQGERDPTSQPHIASLGEADAPATAETSLDAAGQAQLAGLLHRLMAERRHTEEHTVAMLDTLQQAMIRVLDRMDAIESTHGEAPSEIAEPADPEHHEPKADTHSAPEHQRPEPEPEPAIEHQARRNMPVVESHDSYFIDFDDDPVGAGLHHATQLATNNGQPELQSTIVQIRRNFIADAERGRHKGIAAEMGGPPQGSAQPPRPSRHKRTLLDRLMHPTSKQLAVAALGLMVPLNGMFLYLVMKPSGTHDQAGMSAAAEDLSLPSDRLTEASQALASEPPISQANEPSPGIESLSRIGPPTATAEAIALTEPAAPAATTTSEAPPKRLEMPPAIVGPLSLRRAAADGDPSAQFEVGARLAEGKGIDQDFKNAIEWYQRSASHGFAQAQYRIGTHYERGLGVEKDAERARVWYQRAAEQGNVKAMHNLAVLSTNRPDAKPDYTEALHWFSEAAQYNLPDSQFNLAILHENGLGVAKDPKTAFYWFALAARNGDKEAIKRREAVKSQLSTDALIAAESEVRTFRAKPQLPIVNDARVAGELWKKRQVSEN